ncbi:hypothetical protein XELAEV_18039416mg [Xenopus laevis]|uniref:Uncharacterized protein n=1 Tax=Xenopus laevis TaxID=8355 RepID=A0A974H848_XENLA|nr:hypothetical protein XELAEV_18039416mg [Xenopus laevis]
MANIQSNGYLCSQKAQLLFPSQYCQSGDHLQRFIEASMSTKGMVKLLGLCTYCGNVFPSLVINSYQSACLSSVKGSIEMKYLIINLSFQGVLRVVVNPGYAFCFEST